MKSSTAVIGSTRLRAGWTATVAWKNSTTSNSIARTRCWNKQTAIRGRLVYWNFNATQNTMFAMTTPVGFWWLLWVMQLDIPQISCNLLAGFSLNMQRNQWFFLFTWWFWLHIKYKIFLLVIFNKKHFTNFEIFFYAATRITHPK